MLATALLLVTTVTGAGTCEAASIDKRDAKRRHCRGLSRDPPPRIPLNSALFRRLESMKVHLQFFGNEIAH